MAFKRDVHAFQVYRFGVESLIICSARFAISRQIRVESLDLT